TEDGIRDFHVTGVQTCALPISIPTSCILSIRERLRPLRSTSWATSSSPDFIRKETFWDIRICLKMQTTARLLLPLKNRKYALLRSEERRVGKVETTRCLM